MFQIQVVIICIWSPLLRRLWPKPPYRKKTTQCHKITCYHATSDHSKMKSSRISYALYSIQIIDSKYFLKQILKATPDEQGIPNPTWVCTQQEFMKMTKLCTLSFFSKKSRIKEKESCVHLVTLRAFGYMRCTSPKNVGKKLYF